MVRLHPDASLPKWKPTMSEVGLTSGGTSKFPNHRFSNGEDASTALLESQTPRDIL